MKVLSAITYLIVALGAATLNLSAEPNVGFGELYYEGEVVRTVVPPAAMKKTGTDDLFLVPNQHPVIAVAPGDKEYRGGKWAVHLVEWVNAPYLLNSAEDVHAAYYGGDISLTRAPEADFKCPVQP